MINDYEEEMINKMINIEKYLNEECFIHEEGFTTIHCDFVGVLERVINFLYNFIDIFNIKPCSVDEDLQYKVVMSKIRYYEILKDICMNKEVNFYGY